MADAIQIAFQNNAKSLRRRLEAIAALWKSSAIEVGDYGTTSFAGYVAAGQSEPDAVLTVLREGVVLCRLLNLVKPGAVPSINGDTTRQFLCKENVWKFLNGCKASLNMEYDEMFQISELFGDNILKWNKAMNTVKILLAKAEALGLATDEKLTKNEVVPETKPTEQQMKSQVVNELVQTERTYVTELEQIVKARQKVVASGMMTETETYDLFANVDDVWKAQKAFLAELEAHDKEKLGELFLVWAKKFGVYTQYCVNHEVALSKIPVYKDRLQKIDIEIELSYELSSFLIKPVQRICKYPLLLNEIIKYSAEANRPVLLEALNAMKSVTVHTNELKRRREVMKVVSDLEKRLENWKGTDLRCFGELILDDTLTHMETAASGDAKEYHFFLFEKLLMYCEELYKKKEPMYRIKGKISVRPTILGIGKVNSPPLSFKVLRLDDPTKHFIVVCSSQAQQQKWVEAFGRLLKRNQLAQSTVRNELPVAKKATAAAHVAAAAATAAAATATPAATAASPPVQTEDDQVQKQLDELELLTAKLNVNKQTNRISELPKPAVAKSISVMDLFQQAQPVNVSLQPSPKPTLVPSEKPAPMTATERAAAPPPVAERPSSIAASAAPLRRTSATTSPPASQNSRQSLSAALAAASEMDALMRDLDFGFPEEEKKPEPVPSSSSAIAAVEQPQEAPEKKVADAAPPMPPVPEEEAPAMTNDDLFPTCAYCSMAIMESCLQVSGLCFHNDHFKCCQCNRDVTDEEIFVKEGGLYCRKDYLESFLPICGGCGNAIVGAYIQRGGETWHPEHFVCHHCDCPLDGQPFVECDGFPYCHKDYTTLFGPRCCACNENISDSGMTCNGRSYHANCFNCKYCGISLLGKKIFENEANIYCEEDFFRIKVGLCDVCNLPLKGGHMSSNGIKFHPDCFQCHTCAMKLQGQKACVKPNDKWLYCERCATQR